MAVNFQRRNIGRLADMPTFNGNGTEAYVDYGAAPIAQANNEPAPAPSEGEVTPAAVASARGGMASAEQAAAQLLAAAEAQRKSAGSPLNRVLSGVGGVIGAPFAFLDAALNGGDMTQVTAPFRPQQSANQRYAQTVMAIQDNLAKIRENYAQMGSANAAALKTSLATDRESNDAAFADAGRWAAGMLYVDPSQRAQVARDGLPILVERHPELKPFLKTFTDLSDASLSRLATMTKDENANKLLQDYLGNKVINTGEGSGAVIYNRPGLAPQVFDRSAEDPRLRTLNPTPSIGAKPIPFSQGPSAQDILAGAQQSGVITANDLATVSKQLQLGPNGEAQMQAWLKDNNVAIQQPQGELPAVSDTPPPPPGFVVEH